MNNDAVHPPDDADDWQDAVSAFEHLGDEPLATRPEDYPGLEVQTILRVKNKRFVAGKQFAPDSTEKQRAIKVSDYNIGSEFVSSYAIIDGLDAVFLTYSAN